MSSPMNMMDIIIQKARYISGIGWYLVNRDGQSNNLSRKIWILYLAKVKALLRPADI
jgi:hypothetical protein